MNEIVSVYHYAVFTEITYGLRHWQGHGYEDGVWLPVAAPTDSESNAKLDCHVAAKARLLGEDQYRVNPNVQTFEWSGPRRILR